MTSDPKDSKAWRDFGHTVSVLIAPALAEYEIAKQQRGSNLERRFEISLLAAAATDELSLPRSAVTAPGGGLAVTFEERGNELWVTLQLKGFAALSALAGREARLRSTSGAIDYGFRFSAEGTAVCVLANEAGVRQGLAHFEVLEVLS